MLGWALFLIVALIAAVLASAASLASDGEIAKIIFFVAIVLFAIAAISGLMRGARQPCRTLQSGGSAPLGIATRGDSYRAQVSRASG